MDENQRWHAAWAKLNAMHKHPPTSWDEAAVTDFHGVLDLLESAAPGENLGIFRVTDAELKTRPVSIRRASYSGAPGSITMGKKRYADQQRMLQRLEAVSSYFIHRQPAPEQRGPIGFQH